MRGVTGRGHALGAVLLFAAAIGACGEPGGAAVDAGRTDAGAADAGGMDAGMVADAGARDAGEREDVGAAEDGGMGPGDAGVVVPVTVELLPVTDCGATSETLAFTESTLALGVDFFAPWTTVPVPAKRDHHVGGGAVVADLTGDDSPDFVFTAVHGSPAVFLNDGAGSFSRRGDSGIEGLAHSVSVYAVDLDADGLRDLVFTAWDGVHPFRNLGGGAFERRAPLFVPEPDERPTFLSWSDFDGDGFVDVYVGVGPDCFRAVDGWPCGAVDVLLHGLGGFDFEDVSDRLGTAEDRSGLAMAGGWHDLDRDGDLDFFLVNDAGSYIVPNRFFVNAGRGSVEAMPEDSVSIGLNIGMAGMGIAFGDVDADGGRLLAVADLRRLRVFSLATGASSYAEETIMPIFEGLTLPIGSPAAWSVELEDLDHDGDQDLMVAWSYLLPYWWWDTSLREEDLGASLVRLPPLVFLREDGAFVERGGLLAGAPPSWNWRTVLPVDLNHDGALDLVFTSLMGPVSIMMGRCTGGGWLEVQVRQPGGNPDALGALVEITTAGGTQWRRISMGSTGAYSGREPLAHFGLAGHPSARVRITWPDGASSDAGTVLAGQRIRTTRSPAPAAP